MKPDQARTSRNVTRLLQLADFIEGVDEQLFNMAAFSEELECGTAHCIAGWAAVLFDVVDEPLAQDNWRKCGEALGLNKAQRNALFFPQVYSIPWCLITREHAAAVLRHLAFTGEVDWSVKP